MTDGFLLKYRHCNAFVPNGFAIVLMEREAPSNRTVNKSWIMAVSPKYPCSYWMWSNRQVALPTHPSTPTYSGAQRFQTERGLVLRSRRSLPQCLTYNDRVAHILVRSYGSHISSRLKNGFQAANRPGLLASIDPLPCSTTADSHLAK